MSVCLSIISTKKIQITFKKQQISYPNLIPVIRPPSPLCGRRYTPAPEAVPT